MTRSIRYGGMQWWDDLDNTALDQRFTLTSDEQQSNLQLSPSVSHVLDLLTACRKELQFHNEEYQYITPKSLFDLLDCAIEAIKKTGVIVGPFQPPSSSC